MAQRHHAQGVAVVRVMQLHALAPTVLAPIGHIEQAQLVQRPRGLANQDTVRVPLPLASGVLPVLLAMGFAPALLGRALFRRGAGALPLFPRPAPFPRPPRLAVGVVVGPRVRATLLGVRPVAPPLPRAGARLARRLAPARLVVEIELHQVLRLAARRACLRHRMIRIAGPIHGGLLIRLQVSGSGFRGSGSGRVAGCCLVPQVLSVLSVLPVPWAVEHPAQARHHAGLPPFTLTTGTPPLNMRGKSGNPRLFSRRGRNHPQMTQINADRIRTYSRMSHEMTRKARKKKGGEEEELPANEHEGSRMKRRGGSGFQIPC